MVAFPKSWMFWKTVSGFVPIIQELLNDLDFSTLFSQGVNILPISSLVIVFRFLRYPVMFSYPSRSVPNCCLICCFILASLYLPLENKYERGRNYLFLIVKVMNEVSDQDHFSYFLEKLKIHLDLFSEQNEKVILEKNVISLVTLEISSQILTLVTTFIFASLI